MPSPSRNAGGSPAFWRPPQSRLAKARSDRQHWLPKTYLRHFSAGDNQTIYCLDLLRHPRTWRHVGFNDIVNTRGYHTHPIVGKAIDLHIVQSYAALMEKIVGIRQSLPLSDVLNKDEIDDLLLFVRVHMHRNPLFLYRWLQNVIRKWVILEPEAPLAESLVSESPLLAKQIELLRSVNRETGHETSKFQEEAFIIALLHEMLWEDVDFERWAILPMFERWIFEAAAQPEDVRESLSLVYSKDTMYTVDNPFWLSQFPPGQLLMAFPLTPHHLFVRKPKELIDIFAIDPIRAMMPLPYMSFSTKILSPRPLDFTLLCLKPLPHVIDPANKDVEADCSQFVNVTYFGLPVREHHFETRKRRRTEGG